MTDGFHRIVCGVDDTPAGIEAARQAKRLAAPDAALLLVGVVDPGLAVQAGWAASNILDALEEEERSALSVARVVTRGSQVETRLVSGTPADSVVRLAEEEDADLVAVGTHEHSRLAGIVTGSVTTYALHEAPCSVLVARPCGRPDLFPRTIVVGFDGSENAVEALTLARELASTTGAGLKVVTACGGKKVQLDPIRAHAPEAVYDERTPVEALVSESEGADLVVIGSRGVHGVSALGSVSERVGHQAKSSVLVVRDPDASRP